MQVTQAKGRIFPIRLHGDQSFEQLLGVPRLAFPLRGEGQIPQHAGQFRRNRQCLLIGGARTRQIASFLQHCPQIGVCLQRGWPQPKRFLICLASLFEPARFLIRGPQIEPAFVGGGIRRDQVRAVLRGIGIVSPPQSGRGQSLHRRDGLGLGLQ